MTSRVYKYRFIAKFYKRFRLTDKPMGKLPLDIRYSIAFKKWTDIVAKSKDRMEYIGDFNWYGHNYGNMYLMYPPKIDMDAPVPPIDFYEKCSVRVNKAANSIAGSDGELDFFNQIKK